MCEQCVLLSDCGRRISPMLFTCCSQFVQSPCTVCTVCSQTSASSVAAFGRGVLRRCAAHAAALGGMKNAGAVGVTFGAEHDVPDGYWNLAILGNEAWGVLIIIIMIIMIMVIR